ncbi:hypothetical protein EUTSA_v10024809mg [Eutrema salsugineum]|uniref:Crossover junction endonuclease MUS81 n=1 Tax=Eutrema salsugineum TaxID=72664 RepID=V4MMY1_EUTSA|nr:hypothetical protein EUTSA_v10024809mg [Eutrema salsugineum]
MDDERSVLCRENQGLADYVLQKKREHADKPKGLSENMGRTFLKAYNNVCDSKDPISSLKDLSQIKGFGKCMLNLMKGYFDTGAGSSGTKATGRKRYIPQIKSAGYALLITLHRGTPNEKDFMRKQELIDAADSSGLSHVPIAPEKGKGKIGLGISKREWYSGWSCMTTLAQKGLVVKYSNPAKYKLTVEGREVANECIMRSGLSNSPPDISSDDDIDLAQPYADPKSKADSPGPTKAQPCYIDLEGSPAMKSRSCNDGNAFNPCSSGSSHALKAFSSSVSADGTGGTTNVPRLPPLTFGEAFEEAYQVIMILDDREQFATKGKKVENICSEFKIKIEVRHLPVGDCIWIARHNRLGTEYVLDFIVERKTVDDLRSSISDNRYKEQKLRLQRSGLKKLIYILEGDPNQSEAAGKIKTACFTTEILEGFDVLRTNGIGETLRKYGYLTKSIHQYYKSRVNDDQSKVAALCPSFDSFVKRCQQDHDEVTISDLFAIQLMQVPQVTEEIAIAVLDMYPTLSSLASAYANLEGNVSAQEEMLRNRCNNVTCATASKNIFKLVWGE